MSEIYILNKNGVSVKTFTEETGLISTKFEEGLNKGSSFLFELDATVHGAEHVKEENKVIFKDKEGDLRLFVIKEIDDINTIDGGAVTEATCEPESMELKDKIIVDRRFNNQTAQTALNAALEGTRWTGVVEAELGNASTNFYYITAIDAIWKILEVWGGEFKDVVEFDGNKITARKIIIKQRLGADNGLRFEIDHNIDEIQRTVISYPVTAMYGRGASLEIEDEDGNATGGHTRYIDFRDVEWSVAKGDPVNKPKGDPWVGDPQALLEYGYEHEGKLLHREAEFSNQDYEDPEELLQATWEALQQAKEPEVNYRLTVDVSDQNIALGDTVRAIDREFARPIEIQTRIISIEYDILDVDGSVTVEMGQFLSAYEDDRLDQVIDTIDRNQGKWGADSGPITNDRFPDIKPGTPINVEAIGAFETIQLHWDYDSKVYISHYEVYGSKVKDFVPDSQHLLWRGRVSSFTHEVKADETWYYRLRAVNTRGTASDYSNQVTASSRRIITDDILFGSIVADHLENNLDIADKLAQNTIDRINEGPRQEITYTQQEIEATEERLNKDLNSRIDDVNASIDGLNLTAKNLKARVDETDDLLAQHDGKFSSIETDIDNIDGRISSTITDVKRIDNTVDSHTSTLTQQADLINAKVEDTTYQKDKSGILSSIEANATELSLLAEGLEVRVTREEFESLEYENRNLIGSFNLREWAQSSNKIVTSSVGLCHVVRLEANKAYTISRKNKDNNNRFRLFFYETETNNEEELLGLEADKYNSYDGEMEVTFNSEGYKWLIIYLTNQRSIDDVSLAFVKLEKGKKTTDWSPAPEDTDEELTLIKDRVTTTEADLKVHAGLISAKAERNEVYTKSQVDTSLGKKVDTTVYNSKVGELTTSIDRITGRVSKTETNINSLTGEMTSAKSEIASLKIESGKIEQNVSSIISDIGNLENLVKNPTITGSISGWTGGSVAVVKQDFEGTSINVLRNQGTVNATTYSSWFNVNPSKAYEITIWVKKSAKVGRYYFGVHGSSGDNSNNIGFDQVQRSDGVVSSKNNTNAYFQSGTNNATTTWTKLTCYLMPSGTTPSAMKGIGENVQRNMIMNPNLKQVRLRWLNYENDGTTRYMYVAMPKVVEVSDANVNGIAKAEGSITTLAGQVELKASQTEVNSLTGRMSSAESTLKVLPSEIDLKVSEGITAGAGDNLVPDGSFENNGIGWRGISGRSSIVSSEKHSGEKSLRFTAGSGTTSIGLIKKIPVIAGNTYKISAWYKTTSDANGTSGNQKLRVADQDGSINNGVSAGFGFDGARTSWMYNERTFTVPNGCTAFSVAIVANNTRGTVYWDDIVIKDITGNVDKTNVLSSINLSKEGVRITGNKIHLTGQTLMDDAIIGTAAIANLSVTNQKIANLAVGTGQIQNLAVTNAKIANLAVDDAKIANVSVNKLKAGEIDTSKIKIRGGSAIDYMLIDGSYLESRGKYTRTWKGQTTTRDIKIKFENGYMRARNDSLDQSLYYSDFGISTYADGVGDGVASGTLEFFSYQYGNARGVTLQSFNGAVALNADNNKIILDAKNSIDLISVESPINIKPQSEKPGYNTFQFVVANGESSAETHGYLMYGSDVNGWGAGLRFSKKVSDPYIDVVDANFNTGGKTRLEAGELRANEIYKRDRSYGVYWNKSGGGTLNNGNALEAGGIRTIETADNFYIGTRRGGVVRITDGNGYNDGKGVTYNDLEARQLFANTLQWNNGAPGTNIYIKPSAEVRITAPNTTDSYKPLRTSKVYETSSEKFKQDIKRFEGKALDLISSSVIYEYEKDGSYGKEIGFIIERETPGILINEDAIDGYSHRSLNTKAIQELDTKVTSLDRNIYDLQTEVDWLKLENQYLKQKIKQLEEKIV